MENLFPLVLLTFTAKNVVKFVAINTAILAAYTLAVGLPILLLTKVVF